MSRKRSNFIATIKIENVLMIIKHIKDNPSSSRFGSEQESVFKESIRIPK